MLIASCLTWLSACATGAPAGSRSQLALMRPEPFSRPAAPRTVPPPAEVASTPVAVPRGARDSAVAIARGLVGKSKVVLNGKKYGDDCTGLVRGVYSQLGMELMGRAESGDNGVTAIYRYAQNHGRVYQGGRPVPGDLVFFRETYDLNRDGRVNDGLTHIGLVDEVSEDGTVQVIHRVAKGVVRYRMNLSFRDSAVSAAGRPVNDYLRMAGTQNKPQLTSQLFAGYATLLPVEPHVAAR